MLCLYLQELSKLSEYLLKAQICQTTRTEHATLASSSVFRMKSRPARGTWVSFTIQLAWATSRPNEERYVPAFQISSRMFVVRWRQRDEKQVPTTSSPLISPFRTRSSESSFLPFPRVAPWMSVANQHTEDSTLGSKAACETSQLFNGRVVNEIDQRRTRNAWLR